MLLKDIVDGYMRMVSWIEEHCSRCLKTERWGGSVLLMVIDAAFTSIGLNYFTAVVPKVEEFNRKFVESGKVRSLQELAKADLDELRGVWRNERSWMIAMNIASYLSSLTTRNDDRNALRNWAGKASLEGWRDDPVGRIKGVGIVTFQYLRMMGGVDTVMPDKIVKRVIAEILARANVEMPSTDIEFVRLVERMAPEVGYKAIALCWMTWLIQSEAGMSRIEKYAALLPKI